EARHPLWNSGGVSPVQHDVPAVVRYKLPGTHVFEEETSLRRTYWIACCLSLFVTLCGPAARAVPAFARQEGVTCQTCHFRPPELNAEGRAYLLRGLRAMLQQG